jgi:hypothetical protein
VPPKKSKSSVIDSFIQIHGENYDYSKADYVNNSTKISIICNTCGSEISITPSHHIRGQGCRSCNTKKFINRYRLSQQEFIDRSIKIYGEKYDYSKVEYISRHKKVKIICPIHGEFEQTPANHYMGGCSACSNKRQHTNETFSNKAISVHGNSYDYSNSIYVNYKTKVKIICPIHGEFEQTPINHIGHKKGCPSCSGNKKHTIETFIDRSIKIHGEKYNYFNVEYINAHTKVKIICPIHGEFEQRPGDHLSGQGCPNCPITSSLSEIELRDWIGQYIVIEKCDRSTIPPYELDIIIPSKNIAIEHNGIYWHSEQMGKSKKYHLNKYLMCKEKGYRLIQIWENEWVQKKDIVKSIILSALNIYEQKIHGRKCVISIVDNGSAQQFYKENHIQGFKRGIHHGLYYNNLLVSVMTINISTNILERFANKINCLVYGSFSRLLKSFDGLDGLVTFADLRYFSGNVYEKNGFVYQYTSDPNYFYFKSGDLYSRVKFQKHKLGNMLEYFDPNLTEYQNMLANGYDRIWDCGNMKFVYNLS